MLNLIWLSFFGLSFLAATYQWLFLGNMDIFTELVHSTFEMAKLSFEIALGLVGALCLWLGLLKVAEQAGLVEKIARGLSPLFHRLMPEIPRNHPAYGSITMNLAANMLGLDNAATPLGLKAMQEMHEVNKKKDTASNAQILFLVLNTSSVTLLPVTIFMYRMQMGATNPTEVFIPILLATTASTLAGLFAVAWVQKLPIFNRVVASYLLVLVGIIASLGIYFSSLSADEQTTQSTFLGNFILFSVMIFFLFCGWWKKVTVYDAFIEGAKEGFQVALRILPYLVAMLVAIGVLRSSGVLDGLLVIITGGFELAGWNTDFIGALPTALMKPFSGSGARAMMIETMQVYGADSFAATVASIIQGSTETTFYVLAVYFGAVGIRHSRHAIACGLLADLVGIVTAILIGYWMF